MTDVRIIFEIAIVNEGTCLHGLSPKSGFHGSRPYFCEKVTLSRIFSLTNPHILVYLGYILRMSKKWQFLIIEVA